MEPVEIAYFAGVIDIRGKITTNRYGGTLLPFVGISSADRRVAVELGRVTGIKPVAVHRDYDRFGCDQHCTRKHVHVFSTTARWQVTGAKATIVLAAIQTYVRFQVEECEYALSVGLEAPFKAATITRMQTLGWPIPEALGQTPA